MNKNEKNSFKTESLKNKIIIVLSILSIVLSVLCVFSFVRSSEKDNNSFVQEVIVCGEEYYTDHLYSLITAGMTDEKIKSFLESNSQTGFRISLKDIVKTYANDGKITELEKYSCSQDETIVYIFPEEPYGPSNVKVIVRDYCSNN